MSKTKCQNGGLILLLVIFLVSSMSGCKTAFDYQYSPLTSVNTLCMEDCSKLMSVSFIDNRTEKKVGGIIIPDSAKEKPLTAEVLAVGSGKLLDDGNTVPLEVKAGDKIIVGKYSGSEVKLDDTEYVILREDDVLGIIG